MLSDVDRTVIYKLSIIGASKAFNRELLPSGPWATLFTLFFGRKRSQRTDQYIGYPVNPGLMPESQELVHITASGNDPDLPLEEEATPSKSQTLASMKKTISSMSGDELNRQLPNLVETIASLSTNYPETIRFEIGVSFTNSLDPLDYSIDQVLISETSDTLRVASRKDAVTEAHFYFRFVYPQDPECTPDALRGAILSSLEHRILEGDNDAQQTGSSILSWIRRVIPRSVKP